MLKIGGAETFAGEHLRDELSHRHGLPVAPERAEQLVGGRHHRVVADVDAELVGFGDQQQAHIRFAINVGALDVGILFRPVAVVQPVVKPEFPLCLRVGHQRHFLAVNRAVTATAAASAPGRPGGHEPDKRNDGETGNDPPKPA